MYLASAPLPLCQATSKSSRLEGTSPFRVSNPTSYRLHLVRTERLELSLPKELGPKPSASTSSATSANSKDSLHHVQGEPIYSCLSLLTAHFSLYCLEVTPHRDWSDSTYPLWARSKALRPVVARVQNWWVA